jgi:hypothetical protein
LDASADATPVPSCDAGIANDAGAVLCPSGVVYVSAAGDDSVDGCSPCAPKKTIVAALAQVASALAKAPDGGAGAPVTEIHVCKGSYSESGLALTVPASILGGYDCATWTRTVTYGYPTFDGTNATVVTNGNASAQAATLTVTAALGSAVHVDGLELQGLPGLTQASYAVSVTHGAALVLSNDQIEGAVGKMLTVSASPATAGVFINGATPEITACSITGGAGQSSGVGSAGVWIQGQSAPSVHGNTIGGGSGSPASGGLFAENYQMPLTSAQGTAIVGNIISAGDVAAAAYGVRLLAGQAEADVVGNVITATGAQSGTAVGIDVGINASGPIVVSSNRIVVGSQGASPAFVYGVVSESGLERVSIVNNMIWASVTSAFSAGVETRTLNPLIAYNTVFGGSNASSNEAVGAQVRVTSQTGAVGPNAVIADNLLIGGGSTANTVAIGTNACQSWLTTPAGAVPAIAVLDNNVLMNDSGGLVAYDSSLQGACTPLSPITTAEQAETFVRGGSGATAGANLRISTTCAEAGDPQCLNLPGCDGTTANTAACLTNLFGAWSAQDSGASTLTSTGWQLVAGVPCQVSKGGASVSGAPGVDLFGQPRTPPVSIGADEFDGQCK